MQIVMLDERIIAMVQEIPNHPELFARMCQAEIDGANAHATIFTMDEDTDQSLIQNFEQAIGYLAAEVGILMDGMYSHEALCDVCNIIREKLIEKRTVIINTGESANRKESRIIMQSDYKH